MVPENKPPIAAFRQYTRQYIDFTDEEWAVLESHMQLCTLQKKEHFTRIGGIEKRLGFLAEGSVRFYFVKDGEELTNYFSLKGEMISSYKSFLTQTPCRIGVEALERSTIVTLTYNAMQALYADERVAHKVEKFNRKLAEDLIICYEDRVMSFVTQSAEERYQQLFLDNRQVLNHIPQHYIANYLGVTPVSLSRIRKRLVERN